MGSEESKAQAGGRGSGAALERGGKRVEARWCLRGAGRASATATSRNDGFFRFTLLRIVLVRCVVDCSAGRGGWWVGDVRRGSERRDSRAGDTAASGFKYCGGGAIAPPYSCALEIGRWACGEG